MAMPESAPLTTPVAMPAFTGFLLLVMSSVVAAVTEEAGFRGYMQGPIEPRYGLLPGDSWKCSSPNITPLTAMACTRAATSGR